MQRARVSDITIHTRYNYKQKSVHERFVSGRLLPVASSDTAPRALKLDAFANATKPGCKVSAGPADWLCRASAVRDTQP